MYSHYSLNFLKFGVAVGFAWGLIIFFTGIAGWLFDWSLMFIAGISDAYIGYAPTPVGSILGAIWGFGEMFFGAALFALLYNVFSKSSHQ